MGGSIELEGDAAERGLSFLIKIAPGRKAN
jgi:hypothetical protein